MKCDLRCACNLHWYKTKAKNKTLLICFRYFKHKSVTVSELMPVLAVPEKQVPQIQLSPEELRILRECNKESFYYRCLPFALFGMGATFYAVKKGHLSGHPKYGPSIKMTAAAFCGWVLGKISYRSQCEDKFLTIENSVIGKAVRRRRGYILEGSESDKGQFSFDDDTSSRDSNYTSNTSGDFHSSSGSLNFDRNEQSTELDDRERPTIDNYKIFYEGDNNFSKDSQSIRPPTTYDELRRRNREDYEKQQYRQPEIPRSDSFRRPWNNPEPMRRTIQDDIPKNAYGDAWDNPKFS